MTMRPVTFRASGTPAATSPTAPTTADKAGAFRDAVAYLMSRGCDRIVAVREISATHPDLHQAFLDSTSFEPANATDPKRIISVWNSSVIATQKLRGVDRPTACRIAARENPGLHSLWLSATNKNTY